MTTTPAVHLEHLSKAFGKVQAVADVSLRVEPGEVVAFLGPNGAGKTTTIDMMLGLAKPDTGTARVFGRSPAEAIADGRVSAVMQSGGLIRDLSVRETIQLTASLFPRTSPVDSVLERAGITGIADRRVAKCSGGEQQRLRFALALLPEPDLILLDEPTTGMDVEGRRDFWNAIRHDARGGRTVMFATHYLDEADAYADRIVLLRHGRIVADGSAAEVKNLASGRTVTATARGVDQTALLRIPGVDHVEMRGERVIVHGKDSDAVARYLLTCTDAVDVEIVSKNLEDAFLALTTDLVGSAT
ncbi:MAG: ABC transporter ATP-binding protein [Rhodococcus fascians]|uniref:ABC transporter ATP-binding protein n=1 Tax=Nocardiaceae TaxID=85025 RepID=UPI0003625B00|nr:MULTISPECIES: ABC transporter ATP-binding protein [Rhodococcus]OZD06733.1 ABC transporter ATP-binding protein [Rhodococcus sp. 06-156-4C]OZD20529.1 ABC transporter ATP-binding protein [Rhodococcus sp. 06-156-3C]OZD27588.1 ABC transporter ATP-binding protein [Rhodococcus sp. 06-156-4a]OZD35703.1 ABC transporter ATP-binding protein [Rhodococcus sp. 06-156-3b]OZD41284.1 ABC transporter ATP-binding protein [Rhodococcus sp. 06-156-3]